MYLLFTPLVSLSIILLLMNTYYYFVFKNVSEPESSLSNSKYVKYMSITLISIFLVSFVRTLSVVFIPLANIAIIALIVIQFILLKEYRLLMKQTKTTKEPLHSIQHSQKRIGIISLTLGIILLIGAFIREVSETSRWNRAFDHGGEQALLTILFVVAGLLIVSGLIIVIKNTSTNDQKLNNNNIFPLNKSNSIESQRIDKIKFCSNCGTKMIEDEQRFCSTCGRKLISE